jgi:hypothetical protein
MNEELLPTLALLEKQCATYHEYAVTSQASRGLQHQRPHRPLVERAP